MYTVKNVFCVAALLIFFLEYVVGEPFVADHLTLGEVGASEVAISTSER
jgi:hypothetical protein